MVLTIELEVDLKPVSEYLSTGVIGRASSELALAVNIRTRNYLMHTSALYRRTARGLGFIREEETPTKIIRGLDVNIGLECGKNCVASFDCYTYSQSMWKTFRRWSVLMVKFHIH